MEWQLFWTLLVQIIIAATILALPAILWFSIVISAVRAFVLGAFKKKNQSESYELSDEEFND